MFKRPKLALMAMAATGLIGAAVTVGVHRAETARAQAVFDRDLLEVSAFVERRIAQDVAYLTAARSFLQSWPGDLTRDAFRGFVHGLGLAQPAGGVQGVGFARFVAPAEAEAVAARLAQDYGTDKGLWPASDQPLRTAIVLLEPEDARNRAALGFDMYSEPVRRAAMKAAIDRGAASATGPVRLLQEIEGTPQTGILIYLHLPPPRPGAVSGFVYSPIRLGTLFEAALDRPAEAFDLRATDAADPSLPLFQTAGFAGNGGPARLASSATVRVAGRDWLLSGQARSPFGLVRGHPFAQVTAVTALMLSLATGLAVQGLTAAIRRARALNEAQSVLMREKDLHLREMSHRLKNALARVVAMARQAARGAESKEDYVAAMTSRLQAMAGAQDMLTRAGGTADLRALITAELAQIYGDDATAAAVSGPPVRLNPQETQALGLTFHELATNSLKYGAGAVPGARLAIGWSVTGRGARRELHLTWDEATGRPSLPPERKGFGTQLLESCIRLDLGGRLDRHHRDTGFTVDIRVPLSPQG